MRTAKQRALAGALLLFLLASCQNKNDSELPSIVTKRNYKTWLERMEKGYAYNNRAVRSKRVLGDLFEYINANKSRVYKGDEDLYQFDVALIHLYSADFFKAFHLFKEYIENTGDYVRSFYHIGKVLFLQDTGTGWEILRKSAIALSKLDPFILDVDQHRVLLSDVLDYPFGEIDDLLSEEVKQTKEYKESYQGYLTAINKTENYRRRIERGYGFEFFSQEEIVQIESNIENNDIAIDFLVEYYLHPYYINYEKAAKLADRRDRTINRGDSATYSIMANMMKAYLNVDRYDDAIAVYENNKNNISPERIELKMSQVHINLLLSAVYAGKHDFDRAFDYLERELAITEIRKSWLEKGSMESISDLSGPGDMLYSLFNMVFVLDEFEEFKKVGRYGEIEELVESYMNRYKHLPLFNRY